MPHFSAPALDIAHERIEDEVIAINLLTGTYFSMRDSAADTWSLLMQGAGVDAVSSALALAHNLEAAAIVAEVQVFVDSLVAAGLLVADPAADSTDVSLAVGAGTYRAPVLERYDDMEELLLLDPIHEVDEAGWPVLPAEPS